MRTKHIVTWDRSSAGTTEHVRSASGFREREQLRSRNDHSSDPEESERSIKLSLQNLAQRFDSLPCLLIADVSVAHSGADIFVAEQLLDVPQILPHVVKENRSRRMPQPMRVISPTPALCKWRGAAG